MNKLIPSLISLFLIFNALSCSDIFKGDNEKDRAFNLTIASVKTSIYLDRINNPLYFAKIHPQDEWVYFDWVKGFDYEEGYEYVIRVWREKWHNGEIIDASIYRYTLLKVISKTKKNSEGPFEEVFFLTVASRKNDDPETMTENPYYVLSPDSSGWDIFPSITGFDYEEGYEYQIFVLRRVETTQSLVKTSYICKEILRKEARDSEGLPD